MIPPLPLPGPMPGLDELDERLLALLKEDARASFVDLACVAREIPLKQPRSKALA